jgi:hypothetical protein
MDQSGPMGDENGTGKNGAACKIRTCDPRITKVEDELKILINQQLVRALSQAFPNKGAENGIGRNKKGTIWAQWAL